jgi:hypothetical protein
MAPQNFLAVKEEENQETNQSKKPGDALSWCAAPSVSII